MNEEQNTSIGPEKPAHKQLNLFLFLFGAVFSFLSFYAALAVLPLYVDELGGTEFDTGLQTTLFYLAAIIMRFYFGPLTDRKGRKLPLMIGAFVFATSSLLFLFCDSIWSITLVRIYHAAGLASFFSGGGSLIADLAPPNRMGLYIGIYRMTYVLGLLIGPTLALSVINAYEYRMWFWVSFFVGLISLLSISLVKVRAEKPKGETGSLDKFKLVLKEKASYPVFFGIALCSLAYGTILTFVVLFISRDTDMANPGFYFTCLSIVAVIGNLGSGYISDHLGRSVVVWPSVMLLGSGVAILYIVPWVPWAIWVSSIAAGLGYSGAMSALAAWLVEVTNKDHRGTVLALQESCIDLNIGLASFIFGGISGFIGMGPSFALIGILVFIAPIIKLLRVKNKGQVSF